MLCGADVKRERRGGRTETRREEEHRKQGGFRLWFTQVARSVA